MKQFYSLIQTLIVITTMAFISASAAASDVTYTVNKVCRTQPDAKIKTVKNTDDETILTIEYLNRKNKTRNVGVYPPGHDMAFFITDIKNSKKYYLLDSEGVAIIPNRNKVKPNNRLVFKLVFERVPMKRFHVVEGKLPTEREVTWHFTNIKLE